MRTVLFFNPPPSPGQVLRSAVELPFKAVSTVFGGREANKASSQPSGSNVIPVAIRSPTMSPPTPTTKPAGIVLVSDATSEVGKQVTAALLAQGRHVRALVSDPATAQAALGALPGAPGARLQISSIPNSASFAPEITAGVQQIAWCGSSTLLQLRNLIPALPSPAGRAVYTPDGLSPAKEWGPVDDVVMGGVSSSGFEVRQGAGENGGPGGVFAGNVTTANNGGFASTRTRNLSPALDLSGYDGFELRVRGDGQRYKFVVKTDLGWDGVGYTSSFDTKAGEWQTVQVPFSSLVPVFRAKTQRDAAPFDAGKVTSLQLMLSKFEYDGRLNPTFREGRFELPVERIGAYVADSSAIRVVLVKEEGGQIAGGPEAVAVLAESGLPYVEGTPSEVASKL